MSSQLYLSETAWTELAIGDCVVSARGHARIAFAATVPALDDPAHTLTSMSGPLDYAGPDKAWGLAMEPGVFVVVSGGNVQASNTAPPTAAPVVTVQPSVTPASPNAGDTVVVDLGAATGTPAPEVEAELINDGQRVALDNPPVVMRRPGAWSLTVKWRNSVAPAAIAAVAGVVLGAAVPVAPPSNVFTAVLNDLNRDRSIIESGAARGANAAVLPISGTTDAPDGTTIEAAIRAVSVRHFGPAATTREAVIGLKTLATSNGAYNHAYLSPSILGPQSGVTIDAPNRIVTISGGAEVFATAVDFSGWNVVIYGWLHAAHCGFGNPNDESFTLNYPVDMYPGSRIDGHDCSFIGSGDGANGPDRLINIRPAANQAQMVITNLHHCRAGGAKADLFKPVRGVIEFCYLDSPVSTLGAHADIITVPQCHMTDGLTIRASYFNHDAADRGTGFTQFPAFADGQNNLIRMGPGAGNAPLDYGLLTVEDCIFQGTANTDAKPFQYVSAGGVVNTPPRFQRNKFIADHGVGDYWYPTDPTAFEWGDNLDPGDTPIPLPAPNAVAIAPAPAPLLADWSADLDLWEVKPFAAIGTASGGAFFGQVTAARSVAWLVPVARVAGSSAQTRTARCFGAGIKAFLSEQSSLDRALDGGFSNTAKEVIGNAPGDFQFCAIEPRPAGQPDPVPASITDREYVYDGNARTAALAAMAASFAKAAPGLKVEILFDTKVGEAQPDTLNDSNPDRMFSNVLLLTAAARADGSDVGLAVLSHTNALPDDMLDDYYPWAWLGLDPAGNPEPGVDPAGAFPTVSRSFGSNDQFITRIWGEAFPELLTGDMRMVAFTPGGPGEDVVTTTSNNFEQRRASFQRLAARLPAQVVPLIESGVIQKELTSNGLGIGIHPADDDDLGLPERCRMFGYGILRAAGLAGWTLPAFDVVEWTPNYLRLASSAGPVTTTHRAGGGSTNFPADPANSATPGQAEVLGFMDGTLTPPTRVELTDVNGQTASGDTIIDPNTSLPVGAGQIIIYPESGQSFDGLSKMYYGLGGYGVNVGTISGGDGAPWLTYRMVDHLPIVDVGLPNMAGWQVQRASDVEAINAANGLPQGEPTFAVVNGVPSYTSTATIAQRGTVTGITVETRFIRGAGSQFRVFDFDGTIYGRINLDASGNLRVEIKDGSQTTWFDQTIPAATLGATDDALHTLRVAMDTTGGGRVDVFLDDVATTDPNFGATSNIVGTPGFRGSRQVHMFDAGNNGNVAYARIWDVVDVGGATPASAPWVTVTADNSGNPVVTGA